MTRKLASVQQILSVQPIEGADRIELVKVLGWQCVAKRGEFQPGDPCVYFEIDSVLPERSEFEFLRERKFRVKTAKFRGALSQGLAMPLATMGVSGAVGDDVTEALGVHKYEPPPSWRQEGRIGLFPGFLRKTDEIRLQSVPEVLDEFRGLSCYVTTKCDGTSFSYANWEGEVHVCSRNSRYGEGNNIYWDAYQKHREALERVPAGLAVQAETCGPSIQRNRLGLHELTLLVFDVYDIRKGEYLDGPAMFAVCNECGLQTVPVLDADWHVPADFTVDDMLEMAKGAYASRYPREGIVLRPNATTYSPTLLDRLSVKAINNDYLLKE